MGLLSIPKIFETDTTKKHFFEFHIFSKPIPILFSIPKNFETDTDTFSDTKKNRNRYRYFFRYQKFPKPIPIPSKKMEKFRNREVSKPKCHTLLLTLQNSDISKQNSKIDCCVDTTA